jgi:hypothetical protein
VKVRAEPGVVPTGPPPVIRHIVEYFVDNALKFAGDAGPIAVELESAGAGKAWISVTDQGPGIPAALGMSMEYGLRASLMSIQELFDRLQRTKRFEKDTIYTLIVLLDETGVPLVVVRRDPGNLSQTVLSVPFFFKERRVGEILAWIPLSTVLPLLVGGKTDDMATFLADGPDHLVRPAEGGTLVPKEMLAVPPDLLPDRPRLIPSTSPGRPDLAAARSPIADTPFSLVLFVRATSQSGLDSPRNLLLASGSLAILDLCGVLAVVSLNTRNSVLAARLGSGSRRWKRSGA